MNPFAYLTDDQIRGLGYANRTEFDNAILRLGELQGQDELMKYESRFLKKATLDSIFADASAPAPKYQLAPPPTINTRGEVIPAVPSAPKPAKPPTPLPTPRFPDTTATDLRAAELESQKKKEEAALKEGLGMSEEEKRRVSAGIAALSGQPRTFESTPAWSPLEKVVAPVLRAVGLETTAEALKPQPLLTPEQLQAYEQGVLDRKAAGRSAFERYYDQNERFLDSIGFTKENWVKQAAAKTNDFRSYEEPDDSLFSVKTVSDFIVREATGDSGWTPEYKEQYDRYMANVKPEFDPDVGLAGMLYGRRAGGIYETPLTATLRGLVLPESVVGGLTSNYEGTFDERIAEKLRQGKGLESAASDLARLAGAEPGGFIDDAAWWLGLGTSFLLPLDLGASTAVTKVGGKALEGATALASAIGKTRTPTSIATVKALLGSTDDVADALKKGLAEGVDIRTLAVANADLIPEVQKVARTIADIDLKKIPDAVSPQAVETALKKALGDGYDEFVSEGKRLGLDEFVPATERGVWEQRPTSILPVGDSKLAWTSFREAMIGKTALRLGIPVGDVAEVIAKDSYPLVQTISQEIAKLRLDRALAQGALPAPEMVLITPTVALAKEQVPAFLKKIRENEVIQMLHKKADDEKIFLEPQEVGKILGSIPASSVEMLRGTALFPIAGKQTKGLRPGSALDVDLISPELTRGQFNELLDRYVMILAKDEPTALTIQQLSTISRAAKRQIESAIPRFNKFNAAMTRIRIAEVFKPQMTRPTGFLKMWSENISPYIQVYAPEAIRPKIMSPEKAFAETTINAKLAAVPEDYKKSYSEVINAGGSHDEAFSTAILKPFLLKGTGELDKEAIFTNFYASYYGGYDTIVDFASLRSGINPEKLVPKETLIQVFSEAFRLASGSGFAYEAGDSIILAIAKNFADQETPVEIMKALTVGAKLLESRPLATFIADVEPKLLNRVGDLVPAFSAKNIEVPAFATHIQQAQTNIINDVIDTRLLATQATNVRGSMSQLQNRGAEQISNTIFEAVQKHLNIKYRASEDLIRTYINSSLANAILTTSNPRFASSKKHVFDLVQQILKETQNLKPVIFEDIGLAEAQMRLVDDLFQGLGYKWSRPPIGFNKKTKTIKVFVDVEKENEKLIKVFLERKSVPVGVQQVVKAIGDDALDLMLGSVSPALTQLEIRSWLSNLASFVEQRKKAGKGGFQPDPAYQALDVSGLYNVSEMQRAVQNSVHLKKVEEAFTSFDYLKDSRMLGTVSPGIRDAMSATLADRTLDFSDAIKEAIAKIAVPETPKDKLNLIGQQTAAGLDQFAFYEVPSFIKQNLLGGGFVPNLVYHMQNYLSGPMLLALTLNKPKDLAGYPVLGFLSDFWIGKQKDFVTPSGRRYTYEEIMNIAQSNGLATATYNMAEINKNLLADMITFAGTRRSYPFGLIDNVQRTKPFWKAIAEQNGLLDKATTALDVGTQPIRKRVGLKGLSPYMQFAQNIDMAYRRKALVLALKAGETEEQAVQTARKALFDYNDLTKFEREYVAKYIWFYRFMRQNLVQTTVQFLDNPGKVARMAKLAKINFSNLLQAASGENGELHDDLSAYKENRSFIALIEGMDKERLALYTPTIPILDATAQLINAMGLFTWAGSKVGLTELDSLSSDKLLEKGVQSLSLQPAAAMLQLGLQRQFGINVPVEGIKQNAYLDPRFVAWLKTVGMWDTMLAHINVELTTTSKEGLSTFDGYYYKIAEDSKPKWALFMDALKVAGLQRSLRDYAVVLQAVGPEGMEAGTDITTGNLMLDALKFGGLVNISTEPTLEQAEQNVRREVISTLSGQKK